MTSFHEDSRIPFHIPEIESVSPEQSLLGAVLTESDSVMPHVEEILEPEYFTVPLYGAVYAEARRLYTAGLKADPFTLKRFLLGHPLIEGTNPGEMVATLVNSMVGLNNINRGYALAIRDAWQRRTLRGNCLDIIAQCSTPGEHTGAQIMEGLEEKLLKLALKTGESSPNVTAHNAACETLEKAIACMKRGNSLAGQSWGYASLDHITSGLAGGNLYLVGARPGMGKSALGLGFATRIAATGSRVLFWSGEMTARQLVARIMAARSGVALQSVMTFQKNGRYGSTPLTKSSQEACMDACDATRRLALEFDTRGAITVSQLRSRARRMKRAKAGLGAIVLDYVGLMQASQHATRAGLYTSMTEISKNLKALAKELDVPVIALSQLSRKVEERADRRPVISDLRDSGGLEQDADIIGLLYREEYYLRKEMQEGRHRGEDSEKWQERARKLDEQLAACKGKAQLHIAKNRHGAEGVISLDFNAETTWFRDTAEAANSSAWTGKNDAT